MVKIEQLAFHYTQRKICTPVVDIPSLHIKEKQKTMIYGKSGCGKSTLLNLIAGILLPNKGAIHINSQSIGQLNDQDRRLYRLNHIGYVLQDFSLVRHLKLQDNIKLPFYINPKFTWKDEHHEHLLELAERLQVDRLLMKYPDELSIGEKQRACLCRALVTRPRLVLADEPTANLDEENRDIVLSILEEYLKQYQAALVMVCHDMSIKNWFDDVVAFKEVNRV